MAIEIESTKRWDLREIGWDDAFAASLAALELRGTVVGRVASIHRGWCDLLTEGGEVSARVPGKLFAPGADRADRPAVGDWVVLRPCAEGGGEMLEAVVPRRSRLVRKIIGGAPREQVMAANLTTALLMLGLDEDFNLNRLERLLVVTRGGGVRPVVILNKADMCDDADDWLDAAQRTAGDAPVHVMSALAGNGIAALAPYLVPGETLALLGSSGVGKSTLMNALLSKDVMTTGPVRENDGKGRHTTSFRQLVRLPGGAVLIDNPGLREVGTWETEEAALAEAFDDITTLAADCKFRDCRHEREPDCAVRAAVEREELSAERLENFLRLRAEGDATRAAVQDAQRRADARRHAPRRPDDRERR